MSNYAAIAHYEQIQDTLRRKINKLKAKRKSANTQRKEFIDSEIAQLIEDIAYLDVTKPEIPF